MTVATVDEYQATVDITLTIEESYVCGGDLDGVNLCLGMHGWGGKIVGVCQPFNYTPECWVSVDRATPGGSDRGLQRRTRRNPHRQSHGGVARPSHRRLD